MSPLKVAIIAALARGEMHGYAIYIQVVSDNIVATLAGDRQVYRELPRLIQLGMVEKIEGKPTEYRLTPRGRHELKFMQSQAVTLLNILRQRT